jgi:hypothetical protein
LGHEGRFFMSVRGETEAHMEKIRTQVPQKIAMHCKVVILLISINLVVLYHHKH